MNIGKESETIEFKKTTSEIKEGLISISSILNKHGKGVLYFGVRDNGDVVGQEIGKDTQRDLSRSIGGHIHPFCHYEIEVLHTTEGKNFIEVSFHGDQAPYAAYGKYYQRFSDEDRPISDIELEQMFRARRKDYSAWENEDSGEGSDIVDENLLKGVVEKGHESGRIRYAYSDVGTILSKLGLLAKPEMRLNHAGNVLFSKEGPVLLKLATYPAETKSAFLHLEHFEGNVFSCIDEAIAYILRSVDWRIEFAEGAMRREAPEIPREAIREIVVNAFAHGDYGANTAFEIDVFKDRVTIYSPGSFPAGYTPEDFAQRAEEPVMLNPKIVNVLFKAGEIESFGSGFERTFRACRSVGVDYAYESTKGGFRFTFFRPHGQKNVHEKLSKTEMAVWEQFKGNPYSTAAETARLIGKSEKTVYRAIRTLKERGYLKRVGSDYNGYWETEGGKS